MIHWDDCDDWDKESTGSTKQYLEEGKWNAEEPRGGIGPYHKCKEKEMIGLFLISQLSTTLLRSFTSIFLGLLATVVFCLLYSINRLC